MAFDTKGCFEFLNKVRDLLSKTHGLSLAAEFRVMRIFSSELINSNWTDDNAKKWAIKLADFNSSGIESTETLINKAQA